MWGGRTVRRRGWANVRVNGLKASEVLREYGDTLPEFSGIRLLDVNSIGHFGNHPLKCAAVRGDPNELVALLDAGALVNASNEHGFSALHFAVEHGHVEIVRLLLARGASVDIRGDSGETPLDMARSWEYWDIVELLIGAADRTAQRRVGADKAHEG